MIKDRVIQVLKIKGITKEDFCLKIGMVSASFRGEAKNTPLNSSAIENILSEIPDLDAFWLLTGKGEMFKKEKQEEQIDISSDSENITMPRKVFDLMVSQQKTIESQQRTIENQSKKRVVEDVRDAVKKDVIG